MKILKVFVLSVFLLGFAPLAHAQNSINTNRPVCSNGAINYPECSIMSELPRGIQVAQAPDTGIQCRTTVSDGTVPTCCLLECFKDGACDGFDRIANCPAEICGNGIDENGDGVDEACPPPPEVCGDGIDNNNDGAIDENCPTPEVTEEICGDDIDNNGNGENNEGCPTTQVGVPLVGGNGLTGGACNLVAGASPTTSAMALMVLAIAALAGGMTLRMRLSRNK